MSKYYDMSLIELLDLTEAAVEKVLIREEERIETDILHREKLAGFLERLEGAEPIDLQEEAEEDALSSNISFVGEKPNG